MANFDDSLAMGKKVENEVCDLIKKKHPDAYVKEGYYKQGDIIVPSADKLVEVKQDYQSHITGNLLIEIEFDGKPSALETTESDWWVIVDRQNLYWIAPESLKYIINELKLTPAEFIGKGDDKSKKAYLVPKGEIIYSMYTLTMKRKVEDTTEYKER